MYHIQSRWRLEGIRLVYYGLRNREDLFNNEIRLSKKQCEIIASLPRELGEGEINCLGKLVGEQIVAEAELKRVPTSLSEARFCKTCCANDYMIPGLEFDDDGRCPMCQTAEDVKKLRSIVPIVSDIPRAKHSVFDAALFYTGGKDSTFMLYYLSEVMKLRVLALTWEIPWMSESAEKSICNAKRRFKNVEFITRRMSCGNLNRVYQKLYSLSENTCACPSLAYVLFYPELVANRVPYFLAGNEPVQMLGLYYNHMAPKAAYFFAENKLLNILLSLGRVLTLKPPYKKGQFHTLMTMKQLAYGNNFIQSRLYPNELVSNITEAIHSVPELLPPLKRAIKYSSRSGHIPAFVHLDMDGISGGYDWQEVKRILTEKCGWVAPEENDKGLHTSCCVEKCKEYSQFKRFYECRSRMIPFSALEIALASRGGCISREAAIREIESSMGFSLEEIPECALLHEVLNDTEKIE